MLLKGSTLMLLGATLAGGSAICDLCQSAPAGTIPVRALLAGAPLTHASSAHASTRALPPDTLTQVTVAQMIAAVKTLNYTASVVAGPLAAPAHGAPARASAGMRTT